MSNNKNQLSVIVNPHPIVELQIKNIKRDEIGICADCVLYNTEFSKIESSFLLDIDLAQKIIDQLQTFIDTKI